MAMGCARSISLSREGAQSHLNTRSHRAFFLFFINIVLLMDPRGMLLAGMKAGTGKSRTDRHRIPRKPTVTRFSRKNRKTGKKYRNSAGTGTGTVGAVSRPYSRFPYLSRKIPAGIPV
jgi:hypothetical protein